MCHETDTHQAIPTIEFEAERVVAVADEQRFGLLACFAAAHPVGVADAMVAGHQAAGDFVGVGRDALRAFVFGCFSKIRRAVSICSKEAVSPISSRRTQLKT